MSESEFRVRATADMSDLEEKFAAMPGIGRDAAKDMTKAVGVQFDKMVADANKELDKLAKGAKGAGDSGKAAAGGVKVLGDASGDTATAVGKLRGVVGLVSPELDSLLGVVVDLADGVEGATEVTELLGDSAAGLAASAASVAAPVAAVVGAAALAYAALTVELERATAAQARAEVVAAAVTDAHHRQELAELQLAVAMGQASEAALAQAVANDQAKATFAGARAEIEAETKAIEEAIQWKQSLLGELHTLTAQYNEWVSAIGSAINPLGQLAGLAATLTGLFADDERSVEQLTVKLEGLETQNENLEQGTKNLAGTLVELQRVQKARADAARDAADAAREEQAALAALVAETRSVLQAQQEWATRVAEIELGEHLHRYNEDLATIEGALADQLISEQDALVLRQDAWATYYDWQQGERDKQLEAEKSASDERRRLRKEEFAEAIRLEQNKAAIAGQAISSIQVLSNAAADARMSKMDEESKAAKKAAKDQWRINKGLNLAMAAVNTAQAILSSIATLGPPVPPNVLGIAGVATATSLGVANMVAIAAAPPPKFHTGGMVGADPSERMITARVGEYVMTPQQVAAAGGAQALDDLRQARGPGGPQTIVLEQRLRARTLDRTFHEVMGAGGRTSRATRSLRPSLGRSPYRRS